VANSGQVEGVGVALLRLRREGDSRGDEFGDLDAGAVQLRAQRLGVGVHGGLRGGVGGHDRERQEPDARADRDDGAGAAPDQVGGERVDDADGAEQVGADRLFRGAEVRGIAQVLGEPDPGHRNDRVEGRVAGEDRVAGTVDAGLVGHVDHSGGQPLVCDLAEQVGSPAAGDDGAAGCGEAAGQLQADSRGGAGDEDGAAGDVHTFSFGLFPGRRQYPRVPGSRQGPLSRIGPELRC
jgi:hypothetical protein